MSKRSTLACLAWLLAPLCGMGVSSQAVCGEGKFLNATAAALPNTTEADYCLNCPPGSGKNTVDNSTECILCPQNTYQWEEGKTGCYSCPLSSSTNGPGKDNTWDCVCLDDMYLALVDDTTWQCETCPVGMKCTADGDRGKITQNAGEAWIREGEFDAGRFKLRGCPAGDLLVNTSNVDQRCLPCAEGTYSANFMDGCPDGTNGCAVRPCNACPIGATCLGRDNFLSDTSGAEWELVPASSGYHRRRLKSCPVGFALIRNADPLLDQCVICSAVSACTRCVAQWPDTMTAAAADQGQQVCAKCSGCPDEVQDALPGAAPPAVAANAAAVLALACVLMLRAF